MNILYATDGSEDSKAALEMLRRFRWTEEDRIVVLTVVSHYVTLTGRIDEDSEGERRNLLDEEARAAEIIVQDAARQLEADAPQVESRVHSGFPSKEILDAAGEIRADLIVLGSQGKSAWKEWWLGSVSRSVVERAECAVLLAHPSNTTLQRVALAYNGSTESESALNWVKRLALPSGIRVRVVSIAEPVPAPAAGPMVLMPTEMYNYTGEIQAQRKEHASLVAEYAVRELREHGIDAEEAVAVGDAPAELVRIVNEWPADLTILGAHAKQGWIADFLGNTARAVTHRAKGAVLVARSQKAQPHDWLEEATEDPDDAQQAN